MTPELLRPIESLLNRNIAASARARGLLTQVAGRSLELRLAATPVRLRVTAADDRIAIAPGSDAPADATIVGTPIALARLALDEEAQSVRAGGVQLAGDAEVAQVFQKLFLAARPDLEEELSRLTGDVAAHHLANVAREAVAFARRARRTFAQNVAEYLVEESHDVPSRPEVDKFLGAVDALREAADRLESRLAALERRRRP